MRAFLNTIHHFLVPSHKNNFRAKALHLDVLLLVLGIALTLSLATSDTGSKVLGFATDITIEKLHTNTNSERTKHGLPPLDYNNTLAEAARNKAHDMFTYNYWAHYRPVDGTSPWDFISQAGYEYEYAGENLAQGFLFTEGVVKGWMDSETHRANILRPEYDEVGFAVVNGILENEEVTLVVQMFGKPLETAIAAEGETTAEVPEKNLDEILAQKPIEEVVKSPVIDSSVLSAQSLSFTTSVLIFGLLLFILAVDLFFAFRLKLIRITGKNLAHGIFLGSIIIGLFVLKSGLVL